jgi:hypothetical protein
VISAVENEQYDVFLSHDSADKLAVEILARLLVEAGLMPWPDTWNLASRMLARDRQISA